MPEALSSAWMHRGLTRRHRRAAPVAQMVVVSTGTRAGTSPVGGWLAGR